MVWKRILVLCLFLMPAGTARAQEDGGKSAAVSTAALQVPEQVSNDHWAYRDVAELVQKYAPEVKMPEGNPCTRADLARYLYNVMEKVAQAYQKEGKSFPREDLAKISALQSALERDLAQQDGYRTTRGTIQEILTLVEAEVPEFEYMIGVNGFLRGEGVKNFRLPDLSYTPGHDEGRFLYRVKPYAYWHPTDYLDFHLEGQLYGYKGGSQSLVEAALYQGFLEARVPGQKWLALKAGRQELVYGSAFVLGADSAFDGLTYDAAKLRLRPTEKITLDFLGGRYAEDFSGGVKGNLVGAYLSYAPEDRALEAYWLRDAGSDDHHPGEYLDILGVRSTGKYGPLALEFEPVYETGKRFNPDTGNNGQISAYGGHIDLNGEFLPLGFKTRLLLSYAVGSGDKNAAGSKEFRNPNNDSSLVGDMHVVGDLSGIDVGDHHASGLQVYTLGWGVDITEQLNFSATAHKCVAINVEDGFSRHLGTEADFNFTYAINKDFSLIVAYDHFFAEKFFRDATGSDKGIDYAYAMLTFNFDKTKRKAAKL